METIKVFWKDKFNGKAVTINVVDFDPEVHRVEPWPVAETGDNADPVRDEGAASKPKGRPRKNTEE